MLSISFPALLSAQPRDIPYQSNSTNFSVAVSPFYQFDANISGGGTMNVASYYFGASARTRINESLGIGLGVMYELDDYNFSGVQSIPIAQPWDLVQRYGLNIPVSYSVTDHWRLVVVPIVQFSGETSARWSSSLAYGGVVSVSYMFGKGSYIGVGVGTFANIEETTVFPYIAVNWRITDRLRLSNPLQTSPAGPAGLEISYAFSPHWEVGVAGAYRSYRFRLDEHGPIPNGVGEYRRIPIVAKLSYTYRPVTVNLYGGVSFTNKIWLADPNGDGLYNTKHDPAPLAGLNISARF